MSVYKTQLLIALSLFFEGFSAGTRSAHFFHYDCPCRTQPI
jgi:hypothetical protein